MIEYTIIKQKAGNTPGEIMLHNDDDFDKSGTELVSGLGGNLTPGLLLYNPSATKIKRYVNGTTFVDMV